MNNQISLLNESFHNAISKSCNSMRGYTCFAGPNSGTRGKTCIGTIIRGIRDGADKEIYIYNICDHQYACAEPGSQAMATPPAYRR